MEDLLLLVVFVAFTLLCTLVLGRVLFEIAYIIVTTPIGQF